MKMHVSSSKSIYKVHLVISAVMKGSGIEEAIEQIYAENTVQHIISGKAVSMELLAHFLLESSLINRLIGALIVMEHKEADEELESFGVFEHKTVSISDLKSELHTIEQKFKSDSSLYLNIPTFRVLSKLKEAIEEYKDKLSIKDHT